jgi:hypothetical protein
MILAGSQLANRWKLINLVVFKDSTEHQMVHSYGEHFPIQE